MNKPTNHRCQARRNRCKHFDESQRQHAQEGAKLWYLAIVPGFIAAMYLLDAVFTAFPASKVLGTQHVYAEFVSPLPEARQATPSAELARQTPTPTAPPAPDHPTQEEIEQYIKTIFGADGRIAVAVSRNECSPKNRAYPACVYHTPHEYSVGIFQINLYNESSWIHAYKVPGRTMEEKIEWLKDPFNNTLVAYKIYSHQGFEPWSAYTNGNYLKDL